MQHGESSHDSVTSFDGWELVAYEECMSVSGGEDTQSALHRLAAAFKALVNYVLQLMEKNSLTSNPLELLQIPCLYDDKDDRFINIVEQARKTLRISSNGKVPLMHLARILNGDSYGLSAPLNSEVRHLIQNLTERCDRAGIEDSLFADVLCQLPEFMTLQVPGFRSVLLQPGHGGKIYCRLAPEITRFLLQNGIDLITQDVLEEMLGTLAQLSLELTCTRKNNFQHWLATPATFNLSSFFRSAAARKEAMPLVLNGVLEVIVPLVYLQHEKHFGNMMHLIILLVQTGLLAARKDMIAIYTDPNRNPHQDKSDLRSHPQRGLVFFQKKTDDKGTSAIPDFAGAGLRKKK